MEMDYENRMVAAEYLPEDEGDNPLRPRTLTEYIGQEKVKGNLSVFIDAAKLRGEALDHVLLYGPPGLGKTTLAAIIANELGVNFRITSGPALERAGDLAALLTNLDQGDVLFIDEVHRLPRTVEEILYPAMEDFSIDIINGKGQGAASIVIFVLAVEMIFGIPIFKNDGPSGTASIVPLVFPLIVGAGTLTTLLALRAEYHIINIIIALTLNIIVVYFVLKNVSLVEKVFGKGGVYILRKFLGIILLAISVKLFTSNLTSLIDIFK